MTRPEDDATRREPPTRPADDRPRLDYAPPPRRSHPGLEMTLGAFVTTATILLVTTMVTLGTGTIGAVVAPLVLGAFAVFVAPSASVRAHPRVVGRHLDRHRAGGPAPRGLLDRPGRTVNHRMPRDERTAASPWAVPWMPR